MSVDIAEMHFMRSAGYTLLDHKRKEYIVRELWIPQITEFIEQYRKNYKEQSAGFQRGS
jgi:ribosomal protein L20